MLRSLNAAHQSLRLRAPFRISRGVKTAAEVVVVEAVQDGLVGRGEAVPYARYGETVDSVLAEIASVAEGFERGLSHEQLAGSLPAGAARNALDCALWDLKARLAGSSVAALTGRPPPEEIVTAVTISLDEPQAMGQAAAAASAAPLIKVKLSAEAPAERLRAVAAAAPNAALIVDPNEGWTFQILDGLQPLLAELNVVLIEQPLPADEDGALEGYRPARPICADESAHTSADLEALRGRYQAVNIKLDKTGGLTEALAMLDAARGLGFKVMAGCMVCSSLGIAPALHIAGACDFADLDGPWWLAEDRAGGVTVNEGRLRRPARGFWGD
ncbi:MAG TPA: N-acetyl-D-Glu racemase DgcA [Caulobacteraceae bacterium]|nr:N-acetyl-D-Glu racemase DgcA [Caulobacteraceae bacterium]